MNINNNNSIIEEAINNIVSFQETVRQSRDYRVWFWEWFDSAILSAIEAGTIPAVWENEAEWAVSSTAIYNYQAQLIDQINNRQRIPFDYSRNQRGLNRAFYERQGVRAKALWVPELNSTVKGVIIQKRIRIAHN
jgi:hypothetical protein